MEIRPLDPTDADEMRAWHAAYVEAHRVDDPHATPWLLQEMRAEFTSGRVGRRARPFSGYVDGRLVTTGVVELSLLDNLDLAEVDVATPSSERRRGHGSTMLAHLAEVVRGEGRHTMSASASWSYDGPADGVGTTNADFARSQGFTLSLVDVKRALSLPVDDGLLTRLAADAAPYHRDFAVRTWQGPVPDDVIDGFGALVGLLMVEAPSGEGQEWEPEVFDAARIRDDERTLAEAGRTKVTTIATAPGGEVVAYSDIALSLVDTERAYQWGTLVHRDHRGHRLGIATKVANLQRLQREDPDRRVVYTWNAEDNRPMVAVNERLGYRPVSRLGEYVRKV